MNDGLRKLLFCSMLFTTVTMMVGTSFVQGNILYGQAVDLIPIQTGNATLDNGLPEFYDCIDEKIDLSKGVEEDPYFEKEPTKHEVTTCYNEVFLDNSEVQSNDNSEVQSNDNSEVQSNDNSEVQSNDNSENNDIERFNSLFGVTG
ncbi:hypothetical protein [Candidatus Nitrosocosmicus sp. T]|jgi:hypothetical protein